MKVVIKLGGSLIEDKNGEINLSLIKRYGEVLRKLWSEGNVAHVVVGGGKIARTYISVLRSLGASEAICDEIGIMVSRLNARVLIAALNDDAYPEPAESFEDARKISSIGKAIVMGGTQAGQSTNAVAALLAEFLNVDLLINATDVEGVYSKPPKKDPEAKLLKEVTAEQLSNILKSETEEAGKYALFDTLAIKIVQRSRIPTMIIDGRNPENVIKAVKGEEIGTKILFDE
ncbi:MAG: UMP kinase [Promethearchaeota archaeon]